MTTYDRGAASGQTMAQSVDETRELISARKVDGTSVYNANGDSLGSIHDIMINKRTGQVAYAVMSFVGIGEKYHPLPWSMLRYDESQGGYRVNLSEDKLRKGPAYSQTELDDFVVGGYGRRVQDYYGTGL